MVTAYFQALGKAANSLIITVLRNIVLFILGAMIMNYFFALNGVILTQLVVEVILAVVCTALYALNRPGKLISSLDSIDVYVVKGKDTEVA